MFTGDFPAHDVWLQSRKSNIVHGKVATDLVKKYFPDSVVLPNIGNHEPWPCNRSGCEYKTQIHITFKSMIKVTLILI